MNLDGKCVIVTGGAGGIGFATAKRLFAYGAQVVVADIDLERAGKAAEGIGEGALAVQVDVSNAESVQRMIDQAVATFGRLDGMFNNAGVLDPADGDLLETTEAAWARTLDINLKGVFFCCRAGAAQMVKQGGGALVNNASIVASVGSYPSQIAYTAAKGGVVAMTREIAVAYARKGIRANSVSPGVTATAMGDQLETGEAAAKRQERLRHIPMGRYATPEEIGDAVAYLLSDSASYVTGQNWNVDGGLTGAYLCPPEES